MLPNGVNTYAGIAVALLPTILGLFGIHVVSTEALNTSIMDILTLIGGEYAIYGRARVNFTKS